MRRHIFTLESWGIFVVAMITMFIEAYLGRYFMIECRIVAFEKAYLEHALYLLDCVLHLKTENNNEAQ